MMQEAKHTQAEQPPNLRTTLCFIDKMPCLNPDGTLTRTARAVLLGLAAGPAAPRTIARRHDLPLYRVRATMRETAQAGLIAPMEPSIPGASGMEADDRAWRLTPLGAEALALDGEPIEEPGRSNSG
jgi:hypothetical protein